MQIPSQNCWVSQWHDPSNEQCLPLKCKQFIQLEGFAKRQWDSSYKGLVITSMSQDDLEAKVNEL